MLVKLFLVDDKVLLGLKKMEIIQYSDHYHSWIAEATSQCMVTPATSLPCRQILTLRPV